MELKTAERQMKDVAGGEARSSRRRWLVMMKMIIKQDASSQTVFSIAYLRENGRIRVNNIAELKTYSLHDVDNMMYSMY